MPYQAIISDTDVEWIETDMWCWRVAEHIPFFWSDVCFTALDL